MNTTLASRAPSPERSVGSVGENAARSDLVIRANPDPSILLVEDNPLVSRALSVLLNKAGYQTVVFNSAKPALDYAMTATPSAAVVDVHLPDLSGLIVVRTLRDAFGPAVPIVVCSGDTSMATLNSLRHVGATYFIPKPLQGSSLIAQLDTWLRVKPI